MPAFQLLHLTDLHFTGTGSADHAWNQHVEGLPAHDQPTLLGTLTKDLNELGVKPELVVVSGDLVDKGSETGVEPVVTFLKNLIRDLSLSLDRLFIVPGNHDVLRGTADRYVRYDLIYERLFGKRPYPDGTPPHHRVEARCIAGLGVEIVGFNSCEEAGDGDYDGYVGDSQRERASTLLQAGDQFRIAVMHHHLAAPLGEVRRDLSVMRDGETVRRWLVEKRFHLVLHGHQHVDWQNVHRADPDWHLSIAGGASLGVGEYGRKLWNLLLGYQIIRINGFRGERIRRHYFQQNRRWLDGSGGDVSRQLWFGVQPKVEVGDHAAPSIAAGRGKPAAAAAAPPREISEKAAQETKSRMAEIRHHLESVASGMRQPSLGEEIQDYLAQILSGTGTEHERLRKAFGFPKADESKALAVVLQSNAVGMGIHRSAICQRVNHILWRWEYTLQLIDEEWSRTAQTVIGRLRDMCKRHVLARAPTLNDVHRIIEQGYAPQPFAESAPDPTLYAVLRGFSRPGALVGENLTKARGAALDYLHRILERERSARGVLQDSANLWWALRTGINSDDGRFSKLVAPIAQEYWEILVPDPAVVEKADVPEIYVALRTQAYTLSNAQDIVETSKCLSDDDQQLLHGVIVFMREQLMEAAPHPQLYLASVHYEALINFLDYAKQVGKAAK